MLGEIFIDGDGRLRAHFLGVDGPCWEITGDRVSVELERVGKGWGYTIRMKSYGRDTGTLGVLNSVDVMVNGCWPFKALMPYWNGTYLDAVEVRHAVDRAKYKSLYDDVHRYFDRIHLYPCAYIFDPGRMVWVNDLETYLSDALKIELRNHFNLPIVAMPTDGEATGTETGEKKED